MLQGLPPELQIAAVMALIAMAALIAIAIARSHDE